MLRKTLLTAAIFLTGSVAAQAAAPKEIAQIPIPGQPMTSFDISFVDQKTQRYYLADRSNKALDIFDAKTNKFLGRVEGFVGAVEVDGKVVNSKSGPDGVLVIGDEAWVGDGDSTLKIVNLKTNKITATIATGGKKRLDEMAYDPRDHIFIGVNNADEPPFATLIATGPGHKILGKISFPDASDGAEQPDYNPADGMFYLSIPELNKDARTGGVAVIDPRKAAVVRMLPVNNCHPNGLAFGPSQNFALGCSVRGKDGMPPIITIMNAKSGKTVAALADIGGADMVAYSKKNNQYYTGSGNQPGGGVLGVIDATSNKLVQKIAVAGGSTPHSVAVNDNDGHVFAPGGAAKGGCSCIHVFAPE